MGTKSPHGWGGRGWRSGRWRWTSGGRWRCAPCSSPGTSAARAGERKRDVNGGNGAREARHKSTHQ
eukprot:762274-Prorocentrum_minimum.AAC.1